MIIVSNEEINSILRAVIINVITNINEHLVCLINSNYSDWSMEFYGTLTKNISFGQDHRAIAFYDNIKEYIKGKGLAKFIKIESGISKNCLLLKIDHENITEDEFNKYITLCRLYGFY